MHLCLYVHERVCACRQTPHKGRRLEIAYNCRSSPCEGLHRQHLLSSKIKIKEIGFCSFKKINVVYFSQGEQGLPGAAGQDGPPGPLVSSALPAKKGES